eukprot:gb/GEZN01016887.1/.p2 GENE.gb/GEZN01016887.1/~~gb/GEZN01016887.1/.p2  ORF type:complete len:115 (-),score=12.79 gb/GEZN01016887.1/:316-660(-)
MCDIATKLAPSVSITDILNHVSHWDFGLLTIPETVKVILEGLYVAKSTGTAEVKQKAQSFIMHLIERMQGATFLVKGIDETLVDPMGWNAGRQSVEMEEEGDRTESDGIQDIDG